jgi:aminoglycoside 6'-N-acetyltransferase
MPDITIRPMTEADLPLMVDWLKQPHVATWFHEDTPTPDAVEEKYLPRIRGESPTKMFISCIGDRAIGMVQAYSIDDYPEYAEAIGRPEHAVGLDLFIGDQTQIGKGMGTKVLEAMGSRIVPDTFPDAEVMVASPSVNNPASIQAFVNAGFEKGSIVNVPGETEPEQIVSLQLNAK